MVHMEIPYSNSHMSVEIEEKHIKAILRSKAQEYITSKSQETIVQDALENPYSSPGLRYLAKTAEKVLVITSDHTRPVPSKITMPLLLREIREGNPGVQIRILIATGFHRLTTREEVINKFGDELAASEEIIIHDSRDKDNMTFMGILPSGGELWVNSLVKWANLIVSEGFIEPHFFAGFSGGRKSILPGISAEKTVLANHCSKFIASPGARTGKLEDNPIHKDMLFAAEAAGLKFILNVILDEKKKIINAFAGHPGEAHLKGCYFVKRLAGVKAAKADIVITSNGGYPLDQNLYQAVKGMTAAESCVKTGGVIIMVAACNDGHGGEEFYNWFALSASPREVAERISRIPQDETAADQWEAQILARILLKCTVIVVTDRCDPDMIRKMHMLHEYTIEEALKTARSITGADSEITVIPDGVGVIVRQT